MNLVDWSETWQSSSLAFRGSIRCFATFALLGASEVLGINHAEDLLFRMSRIRRLSVGPGTVNRQGFVLQGAPAMRTESSTSILPEHQSSETWQATEMFSPGNGVFNDV